MIGQILNQGFIILAVLLAFVSWRQNPSYRLTTMALVADFCFFVGLSALWIDTPYLDISQPEMHTIRFYAYLSSFFVYLICNNLYLAILSIFAIIYHYTNPEMGEEPYLIVMTVYCVLQLSGTFIGVFYEPIRQRFSHWYSNYNRHSSHTR